MCCKAIKAANLKYLLYFPHFYFHNIPHSMVTTGNVNIYIHLFFRHKQAVISAGFISV